MSLDELKHASTASQRLLRKLYAGDPIDTTKKHPSSLSPQSISQLWVSSLTPAESTLKEDRAFRRLCLVPGGRLLIAFSSDELLVYDLSAIKAAPEDVPPLPSLRISHNFNYGFIPCPSPDRKEIRLFSVKGKRPSYQRTAVVYCIKYGDDESTPSLDCHSMDLEPLEQRTIGRNAYTMVGDLVLFIYVQHEIGRYVLSVWNYIEDTVANWSIPQARYNEIFMHDKFVCTVTKEAIRIWALPTLVSRNHPQALEVQIVEVAFQIPLAQSGFAMGTCAKLDDWYNSFESPGSFDFLATRPFSHSFVQYTLPRDYLDGRTPTDEPLPFVTSDFIHELYFPSDASDSFNTSSYALCHGEVIKPLMLTDTGRIYIATTAPANTSISSARSNTARDVIVELLLPESVPPNIPLDELRVKKWDFCFDPMSGRLAYLSHDSESIAVVEYLKYPLQTMSSS